MKAASFPRFAHLPPEIRCLIWEQALPGQSFIIIHIERRPREYNIGLAPYFGYQHPPNIQDMDGYPIHYVANNHNHQIVRQQVISSLFFACRESHQLMLSRGWTSALATPISGPVLVNFELDLIYFSKECLGQSEADDALLTEKNIFRWFSRKDLERGQNVALVFLPLSWLALEFWPRFAWNFWEFPSLKKCILVYRQPGCPMINPVPIFSQLYKPKIALDFDDHILTAGILTGNIHPRMCKGALRTIFECLHILRSPSLAPGLGRTLIPVPETIRFARIVNTAGALNSLGGFIYTDPPLQRGCWGNRGIPSERCSWMGNNPRGTHGHLDFEGLLE